MRDCNQRRFRQQVSLLRRQFLQEGKLPFTDVLSKKTIAPALQAIDAVWKDRIYTPLVTLGWTAMPSSPRSVHGWVTGDLAAPCARLGSRRIHARLVPGDTSAAGPVPQTTDRLRSRDGNRYDVFGRLH